MGDVGKAMGAAGGGKREVVGPWALPIARKPRGG